MKFKDARIAAARTLSAEKVHLNFDKISLRPVDRFEIKTITLVNSNVDEPAIDGEHRR